ncbi:hypothetical protein B0T20DRAFT_168013 [Sordaria brevicollis]|uniref:Uncharacterized protein n=1 Tax=Sordaria brevicollis TaxID=83679 RepID=A0AAE0PH55_SORBR|nr:hypothetical protein B0T20DRAFT_168013 [Sordaria brevicollis]
MVTKTIIFEQWSYDHFTVTKMVFVTVLLDQIFQRIKIKKERIGFKDEFFNIENHFANKDGIRDYFPNENCHLVLIIRFIIGHIIILNTKHFFTPENFTIIKPSPRSFSETPSARYGTSAAAAGGSGAAAATAAAAAATAAAAAATSSSSGQCSGSTAAAAAAAASGKRLPGSCSCSCSCSLSPTAYLHDSPYPNLQHRGSYC